MTGERKSIGVYAGEKPASSRKYLTKNLRVLSDLLHEAHDTLHECTAVLSARDCAKVAPLMERIRGALAANPATPNPDAGMRRTIAEDAQRRPAECDMERRHLIDCERVTRIIEAAEVAPIIKQRLIAEVLKASAIKARRAETGTGSVHESAAPNGGDAQ